MKKVIITWGSEWLWYELSKLFLEKWFEVICLSRSKPDINVIHIKTDLTNKESIENTLNIIKSNHNKFQALINCAWTMSLEKLWEINFESVENLLKVNTIAPIVISSWLIELIKSNEADIVNVGSTVWFKAYENQASYWASKWAIRWINENLKLELKNTKCRVIWFNPWGFKSKIFEKASWIKADLSAYMEPKELAELLIKLLELPKSMEVSEIVVNRK